MVVKRSVVEMKNVVVMERSRSVTRMRWMVMVVVIKVKNNHNHVVNEKYG